MRVVYTPAHLGHDIRTEIVMGVAIPANEVAERAERIKDALVADGGFDLVAPTEHGEDPIVAIGPAIANAIFDAIGVRFRHYPIKPEQVLQGLAELHASRSPA